MDHNALFEEIDRLYPRYVRIAEDVCNIDSPTNYKEGVDAVGNYFIDMARKRGWEIDVCEQDVAGNAVCITMNPNAKNAPVVLSGHIDTVHPIDAFTKPNVHCDERNMYGPGTMDCKGGVVASFLAMEALDICGFRERPVLLILQSDEEKGSAPSGLSTVRYMCERAKGAVAFLNTEGSVGSTLVLSRKGIIGYEFTVHGVARHSAVCTEASSAIAEAAYKIIELEKMKDRNGITCNCGLINGGSATNSVADKCTFTVDIRFAIFDELETVKKAVKKIADNNTVKGCSCKFRQTNYRPPMEQTERNYRLLERINQINRQVGLPERTARSCPSGSDAAYVTIAGIPCVDNIGVEGSFIHSVNEYLVLGSIARSAKQLAAIACYI